MKKRLAAQRYLPYQHAGAAVPPTYAADPSVYQYHLITIFGFNNYTFQIIYDK